MRFDYKKPLSYLSKLRTDIWDSHIHIWDAGAFYELERWAQLYSIKKFLGIAQPGIKKTLEEYGKASKIYFAYYLPMRGFAEHKPQIILEAIDEAIDNEYKMVKLWFGPRFLDYYNATESFKISDPIFNPVYKKIEDNNLRMDIHIADPDLWYKNKYLDIKKYRTKQQAIDEFLTVFKLFPFIKTLGVHFGSLPELENLNQLSDILDTFPNFFIDTASTKWMLRELGKDIQSSKKFFAKYQDRILFATDLSCGSGDRPEDFFATRYWAQRIFWETNHKNIQLPFPDEDNSNPPTLINGLKLKKSILEKFYWNNARSFFSD